VEGKGKWGIRKELKGGEGKGMDGRERKGKVVL